MINQYSEYGSITADIQNVVANNVSLLDHYILMQTGQYEYTALIKNLANGKTEEIKFSRGTTNYNTQYVVTRRQNVDFEFDVNNEYYVYSNVGYGKSLDIPAYEGARTYSMVALTVLIFFMVVFKGALFKWLRK